MEIEQKTIFTGEQLDTYFASYVGMEGGNPASSVWFCDNSPHPWRESLLAPLAPQRHPRSWDKAFRQTNREAMGRWQSHQKVARIMSAACAETCGHSLAHCDWQDYYANHLYAPGGAEFKMSLFPLPAHMIGDMPWSKAFRGQPQLVPKQNYLERCRNGPRFRFIAHIRKYWKPKLVVCLGERHREDYIRAFGLERARAREYVLQPADLPKTLQLLETDDTTWVICPALAGASGLTSDVLLEAMGRYLARWLEPEDFPHGRAQSATQ